VYWIGFGIMQAHYRHHACTASQQQERINAIQVAIVYPPTRQGQQSWR
jgi:hypothetical protein